MARGEFRIGTSGWQYDHWKGGFYPPDLPRKDWFGRYASCFDTVEVNNTFYRLPRAATFDSWHDQAPPGFRYALKYSRYGSHLKKLKDPEAHLGAFLDRAERLKAHLGPILVQLPPHWGADPGRLDAFLGAAPSRRRWAVEFRDPSWLCEAVFAVLEAHRTALCIHDKIEDHPRRLTARWTYLRYHGDDYAGGYPGRTLSAEARWIRSRLDEGCDVWAFFNNDVGGHAPDDAASLRRYVSGWDGDPEDEPGRSGEAAERPG